MKTEPRKEKELYRLQRKLRLEDDVYSESSRQKKQQWICCPALLHELIAKHPKASPVAALVSRSVVMVYIGASDTIVQTITISKQLKKLRKRV
jgi:hypothetical protein